MESLKFSFQKRSKLKFLLVVKCCNHPSSVNISLTVVIDSSMERFPRVLQHENPKKTILFDIMLTLVFLLSCFVNNF